MKLTKTTTLLITLCAVLVQTIIVLYNSYSGFYKLDTFMAHFSRILISSVITAAFALGVIYADIKVMTFLDRKLAWKENVIKRFMAETAGVIITGISIGIVVTLFVNILKTYERPLGDILVINSIITVVINIVVMTVLETINIYKTGREREIKLERLEKEHAQARLNMLKNQLNPHFLFNSLNVLSALVNRDTAAAQDFIDEFSYNYRYVLEVIDKTLVELKDELEYAKSYIYLQKIRFGDTIETDIEIAADKLGYFVPPLALQILIENAVKHNSFSKENLLKIKIYEKDNFLYMINNLNPKKSGLVSSRVGLENLKKRYGHITGKQPEFRITGKEYIAKIPLISAEQ